VSVGWYSTRAEPGGPLTDFPDALLQGLAPDGGLYVPEAIPALPAGWREAESFTELAHAVLGNWVGDAGLGEDTFRELTADAFSFPVPLRQLTDDRWLLELHHGPTLAFKDFGARFMARMLDALLSRRGRKLTIIVATSGDTGSAVAAGFSGRANIEVVLLYPEGRVSPLQELQLITERPGVRAFSIRGTFDDCQRIAKELLSDEQLQRRGVSSANSINVGRLLPQQLYYLWALLQLEREHGVDAAPVFSVPSGNLGNLTAGVWAQLGGAGAAGFLAAHNANDWFPAWLAGRAEPFSFPATVATRSNAMDVGAPSNFERLYQLGQEQLTALISGYGVSEERTLARMRETHEADGVAVCPHTAVGLEAVALHRAAGRTGPAVVLATAAAAKFPEVVEEAVPGLSATAPELEALRAAPTAVTSLGPDTASVREQLLG